MPKVILISGGSDGLGKTIAKKILTGNQVVILAHNRSKLEAAAKEIGCDFVEAELSDYSSLKSAVDFVISKYQKIDILINNAGIWMEGQLDENDPVKIKELIDVNTVGTIYLTKAVLPSMRQKKSGQIINIVSQDGLCAKKNRSVYHASKWAITGFTKCLQEDLSEENIRVTAINPGLIKTSLFEKSGVQRDLSEALDPEEVAALVEFVIHLKPDTSIPEVGIKKILNTPANMDNTNAPVIDLNIDPDLITPQGTPPQAAASPVIPAAPVTAPAAPQTPQNPNSSAVIDITPGASPSSQPAQPVPSQSSFSGIPSKEPTFSAPATPVTPQITSLPSEPVAAEPQPVPPVTQNLPTDTSTIPAAGNSIVEDPDQVKLVQ